MRAHTPNETRHVAGDGDDFDEAAQMDARTSAPFFWTDAVAAAFPPAFVAFLKANDIHPDNYAIHDVPRYVRVSPRHAEHLTATELARQLGANVEAVEWLPGYFSVPSNVKIAGCEAYKAGQLYGIDVSSGAAVAALDARPGHDVLDLCCAPGAKLCAIADAMNTRGTLTGVDVSEERLAACRTICLKYGLCHVRLVLCDGREFAEAPPAIHTHAGADSAAGSAGGGQIGGDQVGGGQEEGQEEGGEEVGEEACGDEPDGGADKAPAASRAERSSLSRKRRRHERHGAFFLGSELSPAVGAAENAAEGACATDAHESHGLGARGYDRVLVDAECTHDGSIKHLAKFAQWGWETFERRFLEPERLTSLAELQLQLLLNGYRQLRRGGVLVYSTCSFAKAQNEDVVAALLAAEPAARLVPVDALKGAPCGAGSLPHTLRFEPRLSKTSGLFVARIARGE